MNVDIRFWGSLSRKWNGTLSEEARLSVQESAAAATAQLLQEAEKLGVNATIKSVRDEIFNDDDDDFF